jgi:predicted ATPase
MGRPTITLANGSSKERAEQLLENAGAKLARVQRNALGADGASTYDQANTLLQAGRRAATDQDYVAASGYAEKAATLAEKLPPASR